MKGNPESDLAKLLRALTPDVLLLSTRKLLQCLEGEDIVSLVGLRDAFLSDSELVTFAEHHSLSSEQVCLLKRALEICRNSASFLTSEVLRGARRRVVSQDALAVCPDNFESSQKFRRIEAKIARTILGTVHTSVSSLKVESEDPVSLGEIRAAKKQKILEKCRMLFDRVGIASPRYRRVMEVTEPTSRQALLDTMDDVTTAEYTQLAPL